MRCKLLAFSVLAGSLASAAAGAVDLPDGIYRFKIIRNGDEIGTHTITARHQDGDLVLDIAVHIQVKVALITAYRYEQNRHEVWRDNRLVAFAAATNDDGKKAETRGTAAGDMLRIEGPGAARTVRADIMSDSWWNADLVRQSELLSSFDSAVLKVAIADKGVEVVDTAEGQVKAHHYTISGDLEREVWYDQKGRWVHMRTSRGGTPVDWVLQ